MNASEKKLKNNDNRDMDNKTAIYEHQILDTSSIGILITRISDNEILYANKAVANLLGISDVGKMIGKQGSNFYWDANEYQVLQEQFRAKGVLTNYELRARHADDSMFWILISVRYFDFQGEQALISEIVDITERKQAEAAMYAGEERFRRFTEATNEGLVFHEQGRIIDANPAALAMFGLSDPAEFIGQSLLQFLAPESHEVVLKQMQLENVLPYEVHCLHKDGALFPVETSTRTYKADARVIRATSIRDITERKRAEAALARSAENQQQLTERLRATIEAADELLQISDLDTLYRRAVELAREKLNIERCGMWLVDSTQQYLIGTYGTDTEGRITDEREGKQPITSHSTIRLAEDKLWMVREGPRSYHKNGKQIDADPGWVVGTLLRSASGPIGIIYNDAILSGAPLDEDLQDGFALYCSMLANIIERKKADEALRESDNRFHRFTDATVEGLVFHEQGKVVDANPAVVAMFGFSDTKDLIGRNLLEFIVPESHELVLRQMQLESVLSYEIQCVRKDGSFFPVETSTRAYKDGERIIRATSVRNIAERKQADARLRTMTENAPEAIVVIDLTTGLFTEPNENAVKLYALSREELAKVGPADMSPPTQPDGRSSVEKAMEKINAAMQGETPVFEWVHRNARGEDIPCEIRLVRLPGDLPLIRASVTDITERKRVDAELRQNELLLSNAVQIARMGYWDLDIDTQMFIFNDQYYRTFHATTTEEMGGNQMSVADFIQRFIPPGEGSVIGAGIQDAIETKDPNFQVTLEAQNLTVQGELRWVSVWLTVEKDAQGRTTTLHGVNQDITERKRAGQALQESQRLLQLVMDNIPQAVFWKDKELTYLGTNQAFAEDAGFASPQDLVGKTDLDMPWKEQAELYRADDQRVIENGETKLNYEEQQTGPTGAVTWLRTSKIPMRDAAGNIFAVLGMYEDITDRKRAGQALQESQRLLQLVMDNIPQAVFWKDKNLVYLGTNQAFAEDAGFASPQDLVGKTDLDMPWKEQADLYRADDQRVLDLGETKLNYEEQQTGPTGDVTWLRTSKIPMRDVNGKIFAVLGMYEDITEWKRLQQEVQAAFERRGYQVQISTEISQEVASASEINDLFRRVVTLTKERLGYYHTQLLRYDPSQDAVVLITGYGEIGQTMLADGHQLPMGIGLIGTAAANGETVMRPNLADDPDWQPNPLLAETKGEIAVPIKWQNTVLGVLDVQSDQAGAITEDDRILLEGLCGQIAIAMHSAELVETVRQNEARLAEALRAARLANWEYDVEKDIFTFNDEFYSIFHTSAEKAGGYQISSARYAEMFVHPDDMEVVGAEIGKALSSTERVYNTTIDHRIRYEDGGVGYITVKLTVERDENGKITRYYGANQDITERKQAEEALRHSEQEMAERLEELNRLYRNLSHEGWNTYRETAELPAGFIYDQAGLRLVDDEVLAGELFSNIPMKVLGGEVVGTLTVANDPQHPMSAEDYTFLQQVSDQIALALESARLFEQTQSALAQSGKLFEASQKLAQVVDLQELVKTAVEIFNIPVLNGAELDMFSYDADGELESVTVTANWWNGTGTEPGAIGSRFTKGMFSAVKLFLTSTPVFISDALNSERVDEGMLRIIKTFNIRAATFLPLFVGTHQVGVLVMHAEEPHNFTEEETRLFSGLSPLIATVLENRRQFERAQRQADREAMLNAISQKIQSATSVEAVLQIAARELGHALGAPRTIAQLSMKETK